MSAAPRQAREGSTLAKGAKGSGRLTRWLLEHQVHVVEGPEARETAEDQHPWWKVMCLPEWTTSRA